MNGRIPVLVDRHGKSKYIIYELIVYDMGIRSCNLISYSNTSLARETNLWSITSQVFLMVWNYERHVQLPENACKVSIQ